MNEPLIAGTAALNGLVSVSGPLLACYVMFCFYAGGGLEYVTGTITGSGSRQKWNIRALEALSRRKKGSLHASLSGLGRVNFYQSLHNLCLFIKSV